MLVLFSSASAALGNAGQTAYAAANAMLDAHAGRCLTQGSPALALQWGPWAFVGMAAAAPSVLSTLARQGAPRLAEGGGG